MNRSLHLLPVLLAAGLAGACGEPPTREIAAAAAQIEDARKEGAERYAADRWMEANAALEAARARAQQKDYKGALSAANDAAEKARAARTGATVAKTVARGAAETTMTEVAVMLEEIDVLRQQAADAKVPDEAFADLQPKREEAAQARDRVSATLAGGDLLEAQRAAAELKASVAPLPGLFRQAQETWVTEHPKGRKKRN
jgi:hypothetical protein